MHSFNFPALKKDNRCTTEQKASELMSEFCCSPYLKLTRRKYLAAKLGLRAPEVDIWFTNQRQTVGRLEAQFNWKGK